MQSEHDIRKRLANLCKRRLSKRFKSQLKRKPCNCMFNKQHTFKDSTGKEISVRLCMLGIEKENWDVDICDTIQQAQTCPAFLLKRNKEEVEKKFEEDLHNEEWLKKNHPDIYTLLWVLGDTKVQYSWWQRFLLFIDARRAPKSLPLPEDEDDLSEDE